MRRLAAIVGMSVALTGCSLGSAPAPTSVPAPRSPPVSSRTARAIATAQRTHEYPAAPVRQTTPGASAGPELAIRAFATAYINWTAATVTGRLRALAALSVGQARSAMTLAAAQTADDYELHRSGIANAGTVEAVAPLPGAAGHYVVVTRERTTSSQTTDYRGLAPSWHVAVAIVVATGGGWVLSSWQPEN